jgi:hypothetical protein
MAQRISNRRVATMVITHSFVSLNHTDLVGMVVIGGGRQPAITRAQTSIGTMDRVCQV